MSFNTSYLSADSVSASVHYVSGIPISKNSGNLKLGDVDNAVVECLELEAGTQITAPLAILDSVSTAGLVPSSGVGGQIEIDGKLDLNNYEILNLNKLSLYDNATGSAGQILSVDSSGALVWSDGLSVSGTNYGDYVFWNGSQWTVGDSKISLGADAGSINQGNNSVAIGNQAGKSYQNSEAISIGNSAGLNGQGGSAIAMGNNAGYQYQASNSVAIGSYAGYQNLGENSIAIGQNAGKTNQPVNSIVLNASSFETGGDNVNGQNSIILNAGADGFTAYSSGLFINPINSSTSQSGVLVYDPSCYCVEYNQNFYNAFENVYYVSPSGNDIANNGSQLNPFQTIQHAINTIHGLTPFDAKHRCICVMAGAYTENLIINCKMSIIGMASSPYSSNTGCYLNGNIRVYVTANQGDMFNNNVVISNMLINGKIEDESPLVEAVLTLENLYIYTPNDTSGRGLYFNPASANNRLRMLNCQVISGGSTGTDPLVELTNKGQLNMLNCYLSAKGLQNCLKFSGTSTCDTISNVKFECGNTNASVKALLEIATTQTMTLSVANSAFIYNSTTSKTANAEASGILNRGGTGTNNNVLSLYNSFFLAGTNTSNNYAIQDLNFGLANMMVCLYYMNNASLQNAFSIRAVQNTNKFQLQIVS